MQYLRYHEILQTHRCHILSLTLSSSPIAQFDIGYSAFDIGHFLPPNFSIPSITI